MNRRLSTAQIRIIKTGQIIVNQTCTMDQFKPGSRGIAYIGAIISAGQSHRK
jgi:hypothetical protein